jgi:hypothetical protein
MAIHLPHFTQIHRLMPPRRSGPFHLVLPFRPARPGAKEIQGTEIPLWRFERDQQGWGGNVYGYRGVLWNLCLVCPIIPILEFERE